MQIGSAKNTAVINMTPMIDILLVLLITFMLLPNRTKGLPSEAPEPAPELDFADVATVIDVARGAGVFRIGLITDREGEREVVREVVREGDR
jgi:biopolymer transport protein ExbD